MPVPGNMVVICFTCMY